MLNAVHEINDETPCADATHLVMPKVHEARPIERIKPQTIKSEVVGVRFLFPSPSS